MEETSGCTFPVPFGLTFGFDEKSLKPKPKKRPGSSSHDLNIGCAFPVPSCALTTRIPSTFPPNLLHSNSGDTRRPSERGHSFSPGSGRPVRNSCLASKQCLGILPGETPHSNNQHAQLQARPVKNRHSTLSAVVSLSDSDDQIRRPNRLVFSTQTLMISGTLRLWARSDTKGLRFRVLTAMEGPRIC